MTEENPSSDTARSESNPDASHSRFDWSRTGQPSVAVVEAVAAVTGRDSTDVPPLYDSLDPDALDELVTASGLNATNDVRVVFVYGGVEVTVTSGGTITVRPEHR